MAPAADCTPFIDISLLGINAGLLDDDSVNIPLGKNFTFYTTPQSQVFLGSNGYLSFPPNTNYDDTDPDSIPDDTAPNNFIAPFWTDLNPEDGGDIYYLITSTEFIAQWSAVVYWCDDSVANTFQVSLSFDTGAIEFRYNGVNEPPPLNDDCEPVTIGLENENGLRGFPIPTEDIFYGTTTCVRFNNTFVQS